VSDVVHDLKSLKMSRQRQLTAMFSRLLKIKIRDVFFRSRSDTVEIGLGDVPDSGNLDDDRHPTMRKDIYQLLRSVAV
jgi:hypothetical protein